MLFINIVQGYIWIIMIFQPAIQTEHYHSFSSSLHRNSRSMRRWSSRGVNSGRSFASLKHFWLRSGSTQVSVISLALTLNFFFHFHFFICLLSLLIEKRLNSGFSHISCWIEKFKRGPDVSRDDWTLNVWFWYLHSFGCFNIQPISLAWITSLDLLSSPISKFNVIKIQNEERVQRSAILKSKLG